MCARAQAELFDANRPEGAATVAGLLSSAIAANGEIVPRVVAEQVRRARAGRC